MATHTRTRDVDRRHMTLTQMGAATVGAVFLLVGILGFIPGITTNWSDMEFAGHDSGSELLGLFQVSVLHNLVHLAFGVAGLAMARSFSGAKAFLIGGGIVYLALWLYGVLIDKDSDANFVPLNTADDWLHFALGLGMIALGLLLPRADRSDTTADRARTRAAR